MDGVTEVVVLTLKEASNNKELSSHETHVKCLETVQAAPGNRGVTWSVFEEDASSLLWLVQWDALSDHQDFMASSAYGKFKDDLLTFTSIKSLLHFPFSPPPSQLLTFSHPVLEVLQVKLKSGHSHEENYNLCQPIIDGWKKEGRQYATATAADEEKKDRFMFIVPWKTVDEHWESAKQDYFAQALEKAKPMWDIEVYSHIIPLQ